MSTRLCHIGPVRALAIIFRPAQGPIVEIAAALVALMAFLVVVLGFFVPLAVDRHRIRYMLAAMQIQNMAEALEKYHSDCGEYPNASVGLKALVSTEQERECWKGPYISRVPNDPWGRPYVYSVSENLPQIGSYGADGRPGGTLFNADLSSRAPNQKIPESPYEVRQNRIRIGTWFISWLMLIGSLYTLVRFSRAAPRKAPL
jgi:general secretion pathway protein G